MQSISGHNDNGTGRALAAATASARAADQGWGRPDRDALRWRHEDRQRVTLADIIARHARLEVTVRRLEQAREASGLEAAT